MKAVLLDLDGTLLDTLEDLYLSVAYTLKAMGLAPRTKDEVRSFVGNGMEVLLRKSLPCGAEDRLEEALTLFRAHYGAHSEDHTVPYPGVLPLLDRLKNEGFGLAIVSNKPDFAVKVLGKTHFPAISFCVGEREGIRRKPAPDAVLEAIRALGADPSECVYVGDSEVDVLTAKNAEIPCIAVTWGFRDRKTLADAGATHFADSAEELYERIGQVI